MPRGGARPGAGRPRNDRRRQLHIPKTDAQAIAENVEAVKSSVPLDEKETGLSKGGVPPGYKAIFARIPSPIFTWMLEQTLKYNCAYSDVIIALVKSADSGLPFHMEKFFSPKQRKFLVEEIRIQRRLKKLAMEKERYRESLKRDRDAADLGIDPRDLKV